MQIKIWIYWYIYICIDFYIVCEYSLLRRKFIVIEIKSIIERVSGLEKLVYGLSGLYNGQFVYVFDFWLFC